MPTINQLPLLLNVSPGDQFAVYTPNNGDARRLPVSSLLTFFQQTFASPTMAVNLYVPGTGFNIAVPSPVAEQQWMILQPAGVLASGTITLPLNTQTPDGTEILVTTTQAITAFSFGLNNATAIYGAPTTLAGGAAVRLRFYQSTNSWYNINADFAPISAAVQAFLENPTSANLRAAVSDETGTGALVFATSPNLVTPNLVTPTLVTPTLGVASSTSINNSGNITTNTLIADEITTGPIVGLIDSLVGPGAVDLTTLTTSFESTGTGDALTLGDGFVGQIKTIVYSAEAAGTDTGVLTPDTPLGYSTITFNDIGDSVTLQYVVAGWAVVGVYNAVVA
jgi:hypothetical protein